ncbi:M23 family metallopeptidase [Clostridium sp. NSJ-49]|uniref:Metalloendopeptidase-like membrane protein n=1 Tax=Clostridium disporicum TaxID=84024 RepID=A0A174FSG3_9CLOT|nr:MULTISPECIES: M23 family metallopeptidase [Clostridium]MBC5626728.1 M23 family metallopeptidase [Clostridium sp. NSJ-49]MCD2501505.1 M23 family metallopeptidase [Clostridium sp. NSJ-145]CUO51529.1 metalloendopeptidase-like membrane protein [Clostridium disporicum]
MNSNNKDKVKDFFRKEGFYFVLFICLCIVAVVAAFTIKKNNELKQSNNQNNEFTLNVEESVNDSTEASRNEMPNADRVEIGDNVAEESEELDEVADNEEVDNYTEVADNTEDVPVSTTVTEVVFQLPLEGTVSREYKEMIRLQDNENGTVDRTRRGIDLNASVGTAVTAAAEGKVIEVSKSTEDGNFIVIEHTNGLKTKYANLDAEVSVAVGDIVSAGDEIGTVGNSSMIFTSEVCGDVLNLQVEDSEGNQLNPSDYFSF